MLTFQTTVTEEEVKEAVKRYVMGKIQDDLELDIDMVEITAVKKNKKGFTISGRQKPKPKPVKAGKEKTPRKYPAGKDHYTCGECNKTYKKCGCGGGPECEGCEEWACDCLCE